MGWIIFILSIFIIGAIAYYQGFYISASIKGKVPMNIGDWIAPIIFIGGAIFVSLLERDYFVIWLLGGSIGMLIASKLS